MDLTTSDHEPPRWQRRFKTFGRALALLRRGVGIPVERPLSDLEREGLVQRFEHRWELSLNLLSDFLEYEGVVLPTRTPRSILKPAFEDSALPVTVDVVAYGPDLYPPLKRHIDLCARSFDMLRAAA